MSPHRDDCGLEDDAVDDVSDDELDDEEDDEEDVLREGKCYVLQVSIY